MKSFAFGRAAWAALLPTLLAGSAGAEEALPQRVTIVGSRIARLPGEGALPVQTLSRADIQRSGVQSVEELLSQVSANFNGFVQALSVGQDARPGFSGASLHGLGSGATLVLINGRRVAPYAFSFREMGVDLHAVPLAAIERVEVLKDGASALYGSDAIGGVINFVLRNDYSGAELSQTAGTTTAGGAASRRAALSLGRGDLGNDGYNLLLLAAHQVEHALAAGQRDFASTSYRPALGLNGLSSNTFPANIRTGPGSYRNPAAPDCTALTIYYQGGCAYDYVRAVDILPALEHSNLLARGSWALPAGGSVFAEWVASRARTRYKISSTPISNAASNGLATFDLADDSPFYPRGLGLTGPLRDLRYRTVALGPRVSESLSTQGRVLAGLAGPVAAWDLEAAFGAGQSRADLLWLQGYLDAPRAASALSSGEVNPFGPSPVGGQALLAAAQQVGLARRARSSTRTADLHASRQFGPVALALGLDGRHEQLDDESQAIAQTTLGASYNPPKQGQRRVVAAFAEVRIALTRALELQAAARVDHYSDFGATTNPKWALRWQPLKSLLGRASFGRGFRAPSLAELYTAQTTAITPYDGPGDGARCASTGLDSDCGFYTEHIGGNPALRPERARQWSAGLVLEPVPGFSAGVDLWRISLDDAIGSLSTAALFTDPARFAGNNIVRGPVQAAWPELPGPIVEVRRLNQNLGALRTAGVDLGLTATLDAMSWGRLRARLEGTYVSRWAQQNDAAAFESSLGRYVNRQAVSRWRHHLQLAWTRDDWSATLLHNFKSGYVDACTPTRCDDARVGADAVWDVQLAHEGRRGLALAFGVRNLFNRTPPFSRQTDALQRGYDPGVADPRGRLCYVTLSWRSR